MGGLIKARIREESWQSKLVARDANMNINKHTTDTDAHLHEGWAKKMFCFHMYICIYCRETTACLAGALVSESKGIAMRILVLT